MISYVREHLGLLVTCSKKGSPAPEVTTRTGSLQPRQRSPFSPFGNSISAMISFNTYANGALIKQY